MNIARNRAEAGIRAGISAAECSERLSLLCASLCTDPRNIALRLGEAELHRQIALEFRHALAEHLLLDGTVHHAIAEQVQ
jgi:hypothetical protein